MNPLAAIVAALFAAFKFTAENKRKALVIVLAAKEVVDIVGPTVSQILGAVAEAIASLL